MKMPTTKTQINGFDCAVEISEPERDYEAAVLDVHVIGGAWSFDVANWQVINHVTKQGLNDGRNWVYLTKWNVDDDCIIRFQEAPWI